MKHAYPIQLALYSFFLLNIGATTVNAQNGLSGPITSHVVPEKTGTIKGKVTTTDGQPAAFVNISLQGTAKGTLTTESGSFTIHHVKAGTYTLLISHTGLQSLEKTVNITEGETVEVNLALTESSRQLENVVVEGTRSINARPSAIGKLPVAIIDLPQSISIINRVQLENQQVQRLSDVVKNINGVYMASMRAGTQETFNARGYGFSSTNTFKNGTRVNSGAMPEMSSLEKVEVLKGSAAILYGNVAPGAVLNMVTKKPKFNFGGEINLRTGSYGLFKPAFDIYGPLSSKIAYRVNGTFETAASFRDQVYSKRYYINPSLLFKLGNRTELIVQGDYLKHDFTPDFGIGSIADTVINKVSRNTFYGTPWQYAHTQQTTGSATLKHSLNDNWSVTSTLAYSKYQRDYYSIERVQARPADSVLRRPLGRNATNEDYYSAQVDLTGKIKTGQIVHTILAGVDADRYLTGTYAYGLPTIVPRVAGIYDSINVYNLDKFPRRTDVPVDTLKSRTNVPINRVGVYVQDLVSISDKLKVLAGVRFSYLETVASTIRDFKTGEEKINGIAKYDHAFSPRFGIVYKPIQTTALFASYSSSFTPNNGLDVDGNSLKPSIINQYEAGIKNDLFRGMLSANLTFYSIRNNNLSQTAPFAKDGITPNNNTAIRALIGETWSRGVELDITGHPVPELDVVAGYSYNKITIENAPDATGASVSGERLVGNPEHTANASIFYTFKETKLKGLKLGAGVYYLGQRYTGWNNTVRQSQKYNRLISVDGFTTLDLSAGYNFKKFSVMGKVSNITNTYNYYVHENYSVNPIPPTQFTATIAYKF